MWRTGKWRSGTIIRNEIKQNGTKANPFPCKTSASLIKVQIVDQKTNRNPSQKSLFSTHSYHHRFMYCKSLPSSLTWRVNCVKSKQTTLDRTINLWKKGKKTSDNRCRTSCRSDATPASWTAFFSLSFPLISLNPDPRTDGPDSTGTTSFTGRGTSSGWGQPVR